MHMRCCAHILNLIFKDGLKEQDDSITRIRNAVRYIRSSPARLAKFMVCVEMEKIKCEKLVCLDVETRWNFTFMMLDVATIYESAFDRMYVEEYSYEAFFKYEKKMMKMRLMKITIKRRRRRKLMVILNFNILLM